MTDTQGSAAAAVPADQRVEEAMAKAAVIWISVGGAAARPAWHRWLEGAAYLVVGGAEQPLTDLADVDQVQVQAPDASGALAVSWTAQVFQVTPGSEEWHRAVAALHAKRLNAVDGVDQPLRWARESLVLRLEPTGHVRDTPGADSGSGAAPPRPTSATTAGPLPFVVGRRRRRTRRGQPS